MEHVEEGQVVSVQVGEAPFCIIGFLETWLDFCQLHASSVSGVAS